MSSRTRLRLVRWLLAVVTLLLVTAALPLTSAEADLASSRSRLEQTRSHHAKTGSHHAKARAHHAKAGSHHAKKTRKHHAKTRKHHAKRPTATAPAVTAPAATTPTATIPTATVPTATTPTATRAVPKTTAMGLSYGDTLFWKSAADLAHTLDDAVAVHATWIRADLSWNNIQPTSSTSYNWGPFDAIVSAAKARGLKVLPIIGYTPAWARSSGCTNWNCPPADPSAFAAFATAAAKRYAAQGVHTWEVWNEPNIPIFWVAPDPQRYASLLSATTKALRRADSKAVVLSGGLANTDTAAGWIDPRVYLDAVCSYGACSGISGVAFHPYTFPYLASFVASWGDAWNRIDATSTSLRSILDSYGYSTKKIWLTEYGAPTGGPGTAADGTPGSITANTDHVTEALQAQIATDAVKTAVADPNIVALFWYTNQDDPNYDSNVAYFGLRRADGSAKPAWQAWADASATVAQP